jgi:hypothetical protein
LLTVIRIPSCGKGVKPPARRNRKINIKERKVFLRIVLKQTAGFIVQTVLM